MSEAVTIEDLKTYLRKDDVSLQWHWRMGGMVLKWQECQPPEQQSLKLLAEELAEPRDKIFEMVKLNKTYPKENDLPALSFSHVSELLSITDSNTRKRLVKQAIKEGWSVLQLRASAKQARPPSAIRQTNRRPIPQISPSNDLNKMAEVCEQLLHHIDQLWPASRRRTEAAKETKLKPLLVAIQKTESCVTKLTELYAAWSQEHSAR